MNELTDNFIFQKSGGYVRMNDYDPEILSRNKEYYIDLLIAIKYRPKFWGEKIEDEEEKDANFKIGEVADFKCCIILLMMLHDVDVMKAKYNYGTLRDEGFDIKIIGPTDFVVNGVKINRLTIDVKSTVKSLRNAKHNPATHLLCLVLENTAYFIGTAEFFYLNYSSRYNSESKMVEFLNSVEDFKNPYTAFMRDANIYRLDNKHNDYKLCNIWSLNTEYESVDAD